VNIRQLLDCNFRTFTKFCHRWSLCAFPLPDAEIFELPLFAKGFFLKAAGRFLSAKSAAPKNRCGASLF